MEKSMILETELPSLV